jgi:hypothetical protein
MQQIQLDANEVIQELSRQHAEEVARLRQQLAMAIVEGRAWKREYELLAESERMVTEPFGTED